MDSRDESAKMARREKFDSDDLDKKIPTLLIANCPQYCRVVTTDNAGSPSVSTQASSDIPRDAEAGSQISQDSLSVISGNVRFLSETDTRPRVDIWPLIHCDEGC